ncbi:MAG: hypothetical protein ABI357_02090 [Granulicella sp.]
MQRTHTNTKKENRLPQLEQAYQQETAIPCFMDFWPIGIRCVLPSSYCPWFRPYDLMLAIHSIPVDEEEKQLSMQTIRSRSDQSRNVSRSFCDLTNAST